MAVVTLPNMKFAVYDGSQIDWDNIDAMECSATVAGVHLLLVIGGKIVLDVPLDAVFSDTTRINRYELYSSAFDRAGVRIHYVLAVTTRDQKMEFINKIVRLRMECQKNVVKMVATMPYNLPDIIGVAPVAEPVAEPDLEPPESENEFVVVLVPATKQEILPPTATQDPEPEPETGPKREPESNSIPDILADMLKYANEPVHIKTAHFIRLLTCLLTDESITCKQDIIAMLRSAFAIYSRN